MAAKCHLRLGIISGTAFDLTLNDDTSLPWDFSTPSQRAKAEEIFDRQKPILLVGSPMCTPFSNIQNLNNDRRDPGDMKKEIDRARIHLAWCCRLYRRQSE